MSRPTRIAVLVSGGGTNLQALLDTAARGDMPHGEIVKVISNHKSAYALERAAKVGVPTAVVTKKKTGSQEAFEKAMQDELEACGAELIVMAGFMSILTRDFTDRWADRILNIHPSLLPSFGGVGCYGIHVHEKALARGVKVTGATVHYVNEIPDGGRIVAQKAVAVEPGDTPEILQRRVMEQAEWIILPQAVEQAAEEIANKKEKENV